MAIAYVDVEAEKSRQSQPGLLTEVRATRVYHIWIVLAVYILSIAILLPAKPQIYTNFFASERAGYLVKCESYGKAQEPSFCRDAHSDAVWWGSFSDFVSNSIVAFLLVPLVGRWSDIHGRRPFVSLFVALATIPPVLIAAHINLGVSLYFYFPAEALAGHQSLMLLCTAYVTDLISPSNRAAALSLNMAAFAGAFVFGPGIGGLLGTVLASLLSMGGTLLTLLLVVLIVSESLNADARAKAREKQALEGKWVQAPWNCLRILSRSRVASKLAVCVCFSGFIALGFMEMLSQYLELKLQYGKVDLAILMTVAGFCGIFVQAVLMRVLVHCMGEKHIIILSSLSRALEQFIMCAATDKATVLVGVVFGSVAALLMPASASLLSRSTAAWEQGSAQGALYGLLALSQGFGPLIFAYLFSGFTRSDSTWPYFPGAPYLFGGVMMVICAAFALAIDPNSDKQEEPVLGIPLSNGFAPVSGKSGDLSSASSQTLTQRQSTTLDPSLSHQGSLSLEAQPSRRLSVEQGRRETSSLESALPYRKSWGRP